MDEGLFTGPWTPDEGLDQRTCKTAFAETVWDVLLLLAYILCNMGDQQLMADAAVYIRLKMGSPSHRQVRKHIKMSYFF